MGIKREAYSKSMCRHSPPHETVEKVRLWRFHGKAPLENKGVIDTGFLDSRVFRQSQPRRAADCQKRPLHSRFRWCLRKPPFFETDKTLLTCQLLLTSNSVSLHEVERVVFSFRLPEDRRSSILGQRGVCTPRPGRADHSEGGRLWPASIDGLR